MNFEETKLKGAFIIYPELIEDERGFLPGPGVRKSLRLMD